MSVDDLDTGKCTICEIGDMIERYDENGDPYYECENCGHKEA